LSERTTLLRSERREKGDVIKKEERRSVAFTPWKGGIVISLSQQRKKLPRKKKKERNSRSGFMPTTRRGSPIRVGAGIEVTKSSKGEKGK